MKEDLIMIDVHHHILPGFGKGASSMEEAVLMAQLAEQEGITTIIATPIRNISQPMPKQMIIDTTKELNDRLKSEGVNVTIIPAQHVPLYSELLDDHEAGNLLCINDTTDYLFLDFPQQEVPLYAEHFIYELQQRHITPIIVHPEANPAFIKDPERLYDLVRQGLLVQLSSHSLLGHHGKKVKQYAEKLIEANQAHFIGSDTHKPDRKGVGLKASYHHLRKVFGRSVTEIFQENAQALIDGQAIYLLEPTRVKMKSSIMKSLFKS
jgi:protein-tyrosine phosphatase